MRLHSGPPRRQLSHPSHPPPPTPAALARATRRGSAAGDAPFLLLKDVSYAPAGCATPLLSACSLALPATGLCLLVGRSGAGKSTLLLLLAGLAEPSSGRCSLGAAHAAAGEHTPAALRLARAGLVFQFPERHFVGATAVEELTFGWPRGAGAGPRRAELATAARAALDAAGLAELDVQAPLRALSGGTQRRLALAAQVCRSPALLLLDEPLAGLDAAARRELLPVLAAQARERLVLASSHDLGQLAPMASYALRMLPGGVLEPAPDIALGGVTA